MEAKMASKAESFLFELSNPVTLKPLDEWGSVAVELLGCQTRFVQGRRWRHRVIDFGKGEPLLLIHGIGGHAETFARNMRNLGQHFHVYAIDALYHGYSSQGDWDPYKRHDDQVDAIVDLLDAEGHPFAHIEGLSMGAQLAFEFGLRFPERAGKIIMNTGISYRVRLSKTDFPPAEGHGDLAELSQEVITRPRFDVMRRRMEWLVADPARMTDDMVAIRLRLYEDPDVNAAMRRWFKVGVDDGDPWDLHPIWEESDLTEYKPESLVFWTEHNPGEGADLGEYFASLIPAGKFYLMKDAAHWPQWEKPEEHDQILIDFIRGRQ